MEGSLAPASSPAGIAPAHGAEHGGLAGMPERRVRHASADVAIFTIGTYAAQLLLFVAGVIQKGLLGPASTGYWALIGSFSVMFTIAPLGTIDGAARQIPFHRGRGDRAAAAAVADTASSFTIVATAIASAVVSGAALALGSSWPDPLRYGLFLLGLIMPVKVLGDCHEVLLQATKRFDVASVAAIVRAAVAVTLQTLFVWWFGFYGLFLGLVASVLAVFALWYRLGLTSFKAPAFHWRIERRRVRELMRFGLPSMIQGQTWALFLTVDNLIVAAFLDIEHLGYYAVAFSVTTYIMLLPKGVGAALAPRMSERFGRTRDPASIRHYATDVQGVLGYVLVPVLVGAAFFLMPVLIRYALPEFAPAIPVVRVIVAGTFFISLATMPIKVLLAAGYRWSLAGLTLTVLAVNTAAVYVAVGVLDRGLIGAAAAVGFSYFTLFLVVTGFALTRTLTVWRAAGHAAQFVAVFAYLTAAMWAIEWTLGPGPGDVVGDTLVGVTKLTLLLVALTPWFVLSEVRFRGLTSLLSVARAATTGFPKGGLHRG